MNKPFQNISHNLYQLIMQEKKKLVGIHPSFPPRFPVKGPDVGLNCKFQELHKANGIGSQFPTRERLALAQRHEQTTTRN